MDKPIGGYFEWEFPPAKEFSLHKNAVLVNSGKHAIEYVIRSLPDLKRLWIPYFTCINILYPLKRLQIPYLFYHVNNALEIEMDDINMVDGDYIIITNYYGIKDHYVCSLVNQFCGRVIIDNAQALFCKAQKGVYQIYSPRKFLGMPDGGIVVSPSHIKDCALPVDKSYDRCSQLLKRWELSPSEGYDEFKANGRKNIDTPLSRMSVISENILRSVDLNYIKEKRRINFSYLHTRLYQTNKLSIPSIDSFEAPLVYPYYTDDVDLKKNLISHNVFVATYWPNVFEWCKESDIEYQLAKKVICIPCDQRYDENDMQRIIDLILNK